jgi:hypothetical protein
MPSGSDGHKRRRRRWVALVAGLVIAMGGAFAFAKLRHSGDLATYREFLVAEAGAPAHGAVKVTAVARATRRGARVAVLDAFASIVLFDSSDSDPPRPGTH